MNVLVRPIVPRCTALLAALTVMATAAMVDSAAAARTLRPAAPTLKRVQPETRSQPICCKTRNGFAMLLPERCRLVRGTPVSDRQCHQLPKRLICCRTSRGFVLLRPNECTRPRGTPVDRFYCKKPEPRVCCRVYSGGWGSGKVNYQRLPRFLCTPPKGQIAPDHFCHILDNVPG